MKWKELQEPEKNSNFSLKIKINKRRFLNKPNKLNNKAMLQIFFHDNPEEILKVKN